MTSDLEPRFRELVERVLGERTHSAVISLLLDFPWLNDLLSAAYAMDREGRGSKRSAFQLASTRQPSLDYWRDVATAPRDGTSMLLLVGGAAEQGHYQGPSDGAIYAGSPGRYDWFSEVNHCSIFNDAVEAWMPLPAAPAAHDAAPVSVTSLASAEAKPSDQITPTQEKAGE